MASIKVKKNHLKNSVDLILNKILPYDDLNLWQLWNNHVHRVRSNNFQIHHISR